MYKGSKLMIENNDGTLSDSENKDKKFTPEEFKKLQALMPGYYWIIIVRPRPEEITNPSYISYDGELKSD